MGDAGQGLAHLPGNIGGQYFGVARQLLHVFGLLGHLGHRVRQRRDAAGHLLGGGVLRGCPFGNGLGRVAQVIGNLHQGGAALADRSHQVPQALDELVERPRQLAGFIAAALLETQAQLAAPGLDADRQAR
ncbi:hypothetical protein D9M71_674680 [compost metagenome]